MVFYHWHKFVAAIAAKLTNKGVTLIQCQQLSFQACSQHTQIKVVNDTFVFVIL